MLLYKMLIYSMNYESEMKNTSFEEPVSFSSESSELNFRDLINGNIKFYIICFIFWTLTLIAAFIDRNLLSEMKSSYVLLAISIVLYIISISLMLLHIPKDMIIIINTSCLLTSHLLVAFIFAKFLNNMINSKNVISSLSVVVFNLITILALLNDIHLFCKQAEKFRIFASKEYEENEEPLREKAKKEYYSNINSFVSKIDIILTIVSLIIALIAVCKKNLRTNIKSILVFMMIYFVILLFVSFVRIKKIKMLNNTIINTIIILLIANSGLIASEMVTLFCINTKFWSAFVFSILVLIFTFLNIWVIMKKGKEFQEILRKKMQERLRGKHQKISEVQSSIPMSSGDNENEEGNYAKLNNNYASRAYPGNYYNNNRKEGETMDAPLSENRDGGFLGSEDLDSE